MEAATLPSPEKFLKTLPTIQIKDLPEEHINCDICMEQFTAKPSAEKPVILHCGHIFGSFCLKSWIHSSQVNNPTCPMCRAVLNPPSDIERWELFAFLMQQEPYTSACQTFRSSTLEQCDSAVELVRLFFQVVMQILAYHRHHRIPASALLLKSAQAVASRMGDLYRMLRNTMEIFGVRVPWNGSGPSVVLILDLKNESFFKRALERMLQVEQRVTSGWAMSI